MAPNKTIDPLIVYNSWKYGPILSFNIFEGMFQIWSTVYTNQFDIYLVNSPIGKPNARNPKARAFD